MHLRRREGGFARRARLAIAGAGALVSLLITFPAGAAGSKSFSDPAGDSGSLPDITTVVVSNDDSGTITFALSFANRSDFVGDDRVAIALDVDRNAQTGDRGIDYVIVIDNAPRRTVRLGRWTRTPLGSSFDYYVPDTLRVTDWKTITLHRRELEGTLAFSFIVVAGAASNTQTFDFAPDGITSRWTYELQLAPVREVSLEVAATFKPAAPIAGTTFAVTRATLAVSTGGAIRLSSLSCRATIAGKPLRPPGRCTWRIPKAKTLVVTITGSYGEDRIVSEPYRFRIR